MTNERRRLISKELHKVVTLKNYYKGMRILELREVYRMQIDKNVERATLNRMDQEELVNKIVESILKPLDK